MALRPAIGSIFVASVNMDFQAAYAKLLAETWHDKIAQTIPMTSETLYLGWMGTLKRLREWVGPRVVQEPAPRTYQLTAKAYEGTVGLDKFLSNDDLFGLFSRANSDLMALAAKEQSYQLRDLLFNTGSQTGAFQTGVDNLSHWSAVHPVNFYDASFGTYVNDYRGGVVINGTTTGGTFSPVAYMTARQDFLTRRGESGESLGVQPNLTMCGPLIETNVKGVLENEYFSPQTWLGITTNVGNTQNQLRNSTKMFMNFDFPVTAAGLDWHLLCTDRGIKPFTVGLREGTVMTSLVADTDPNVFHSHQYLHGTHLRFVVGWGHPWLSAISGPTAGV